MKKSSTNTAQSAAHAAAHAQAGDLLDFVDASPSPWHAVETMRSRLQAEGFQALSETEDWALSAGGRYFVVRGASSMIAFVVGNQSPADSGLRMLAAHTDSPGLRLKPQPAQGGDGLLRLGVEIYGGPILATFADRDLSLAGRVVVRTGRQIESRLVRFDQALLRLPNLAIHMNREVNEQGLKFHKQNELPLILGQTDEGIEPLAQYRALLATALEVQPEAVLTWELVAYDTQKGSLWGANQEFLAVRQLDNLASCHAGLRALLAAAQPQHTALCAFFDHEEVGSESAVGAGGSFVVDVIERIAAALDIGVSARQRILARSFLVSADMAHAYHPNFPNAYEPGHRVQVNAGPVIKTNVNQRYSTGAESAARFIRWCEAAGVPYQQYAHRSDLGCGSTIGPIMAAQLGVSSVDVGSPMWAMHSARESAGVFDHAHMIAVLTQFLGVTENPQ